MQHRPWPLPGTSVDKIPIPGFFMIFGLFGRKKSNRAIVERQYALLTEAARRPAFYRDMGVPDTVLGRFEMLTVVLILYFRRTASAATSGQEIAQEIIDCFFEDIDHSIRELGVGDVGVPKRVKKFARMYYGRLESYAAALEASDGDSLALALRRNIRPDEPEAPDMRLLSTYMLRAEAQLKSATEDDIASGSVILADPEATEEV